MNIDELKKILEISNKDIACMFGYKTRQSYTSASRKKQIEGGIISVFLKVKEKLLKGEKF